MKHSRLIILILIFISIYFFQEQLIQKIKPLTNQAQKLVELIDSNIANESIAKTKIFKEVSLPGPLAQIINPNQQNYAELSATKIIEYTNAERQKNGLEPLMFNTKLTTSATFKAGDMNTLQYFEHESPSGVDISDLAKKFNYEYITIGENLAMGNFESDQTLVDAWMNSPGHRANILNPKYTQIGVGLVTGTWDGIHVWYAVQHFGKPLSSCPTINKNLKSVVDKNQIEISNMQKTLGLQKTQIEQAGSGNQDYTLLVSSYNELVNKYNLLVGETKTNINIYNAEIKAFNDCSQN
ncbi:hypothetical protein A3J61_01625 [Candidatus Nomurabacteria bacterium RIFCSPHIGHO2_02_FULL_38_15]|uniref:SCP domain-containing protein n=1 Tax=Candidatus Nomurabacteria bacterium RIFCSPHIGHO2_02_FULL_38_15 TaxID=1801752 RepID=A0A1F6VR57_9BACT|nr:MAG: hypothetical protein A3J61_01625 [Candidatus Nomurabacteria bacterium RIFCSPHIGHO2_02_FULL_38_15]